MSDAVVNTLKRLETFTFRDDGGVLVTTAVNGDFTKTVICNGAVSGVACTVAQVSASGRYTPSLTPDATGDWTVIVEWTADPTFAWSYSFRVVTAAQSDPAAALSGVSVTVTSPVAGNGDVEICQGDDYFNVDGRALNWSRSDWPDLTGATIAFKATHPTDRSKTLVTAGSVTTATGATKAVRVELTKTQTAALLTPTEGYPFQVIATLSNGDVATLVDAVMVVLPRRG